MRNGKDASILDISATAKLKHSNTLNRGSTMRVYKNNAEGGLVSYDKMIYETN